MLYIDVYLLLVFCPALHLICTQSSGFFSFGFLLSFAPFLFTNVRARVDTWSSPWAQTHRSSRCKDDSKGQFHIYGSTEVDSVIPTCVCALACILFPPMFQVERKTFQAIIIPVKAEDEVRKSKLNGLNARKLI